MATSVNMSPKSKRKSKALAMPADAVMPLLTDRSDTTKRIAGVALMVLAGAVALTFLLCWRFQYNSDGVLSSLMARSILTRGERPLYVWSVGYQGVLINAYMNALMFKLFGFGVYQLNFWPTAAYLGFTTLFVTYVRRGTSDWVALLAGLFLVLSNPVICTVLMRNTPNYPETYAMGLAIFMLERRLLQHFYVDQLPASGKSLVWFAGLGFFCGLGSYTYGQIYIFIASVAAHLGFFYARDARDSLATHSNHWRVIGCIAPLPLTIIALGVWHFCLGTPPHVAFRSLLGTTGLAVMMRGVACLIGVIALEFVARRHKLVLHLLPGGACMAAGAIVGYSPALWDVYMRQHPLINKANVSGDLSMWLHRTWLAFEGNMWHLNLVPSPELETGVPISVWATLATMGILGAFCVFSCQQFGRFLRTRQASPWFVNMGPLMLLPIINLIIFGLSDAVVNAYSSRYTLAIWLFYALAFGWFFATVLQRASRNWGWAAVALAVALLGNNVNAIKRDLTAAISQPFDGEEAIAYLKERGITRGYANYWSAYTVNFFTDEQIILQPLFSAYCPHYGPEVALADKIAVVEHADRLGHPERGTQIQLYGRPWVVGDYWRGKHNAVLTLQSAQALPTAVVDGS